MSGPERPGGCSAGGFGVYVHVPYCASRCGYCDFNTYVAPPDELAALAGRWAEGITSEIASHHADPLLDMGRPADTVFFGGGTPTLLEPSALGMVLDSLSQTCGLAPDVEITVEANPESLSRARLEELRALGVNRLSVGMQSHDEDVLDTLDRVHQPDGALRAVAMAREEGFERLSLDLIYGTPGESLRSWQQTVRAATATGVGHISAYALTVERGTALARRVGNRELPCPQDDDLAAKYELADDLLRGSGLEWYEVSNWSRPGEECRHNLGYWRSGDWWGLGPGAHGHVRGMRYVNHKLPSRWLAAVASGSGVASREYLDERTRHTERVMLTTRLRDGLDRSEWSGSAVEKLIDDGLLRGDSILRLTRRGRLLGDRVALALLD